MGRDTSADKTPLLNNAEQNIGNSDTIRPQDGNFGTIVPQTNPTRLLQLNGGSGAGQTTSVTVTASRLVGNQNPNPGLPGPVTGIVEFGNGGRFTRAEFDVPIGPFVGDIIVAAPSTEPQDGGVIITVPTGVLRLYARYDNLLITPALGTQMSLAQARGLPVFGPGGPRPNPGGPGIIPAEPVLTKAMAAYFSRHFARVYKTLYLYCTQGPVITPIIVGAPPLNFDFFCLPAFTRTVQIWRRPQSGPGAALRAILHTGTQIVDEFNIPAGVSSPIVNVAGGVSIIGLQSATVGDTVTFLALSCEIGI